MTDDVWLDVIGVRCRIATDPRMADRLRVLLADLLGPGTGPAADVTFHLTPDDDGRSYHLRCEELGLREWGMVHPILGRLVSTATAAAVARFPGLAVHAGVVASEGRAVAFAAPSGVGKSTLTTSCLRAGFDYVSDEALCLLPGAGALALPLPKPLALSGASAALLGLPRRRWDTKDMVPCAVLGAEVAIGPVEVAHVVVLSRSGTGTSVLRPRPAALAVTTLLSMAFNAYSHPDTSVEIASSVARSTRCWELDVGDPAAAADALLRTVARPAVVAV